MRVSVEIMAHPKRRNFVEEYLQPRLPGAGVTWDRRNDRWDTGSRAMLARDPQADYHLVVQDDALLCSNFLAGVELALQAVDPDSPACFYAGKTRPFRVAVAAAVSAAAESGCSWFTAQGPLWGPAVAMPTHRVDEVVEACASISIANYDTRMATYLQAVGTECWYSVPSLVDHRVGDENPSLVPGRCSLPIRTAWSWIGEDDPTEVDWDTPAYRTGGLDDSGDEQLARYASQLGSTGVRLSIE